MSDITNFSEVKSFAELLDDYDMGNRADVHIGDKVNGEIISIGRDAVFVTTGTKIDGVVEKIELLDEKGELPYKGGDVLELYIVSINENEIRLSKAISGAGGLNMLQDAYENRVPVEGKIKEAIKGGFYVEVLGRRAFCPLSQIDLKYVETPADYVGGVYSFRITRFEESGKNIVVSRRDLLKEELEKEQEKFLRRITAGDVLEGKVSKIMPYGVFIELFPGIESMVHISELSWSRCSQPEDIVSVGDILSVKIMEIQKNEKGVKIIVSARQVTGDPWQTEIVRFREGDKIRGKVTRCMNFGAFVEISAGIEGLVHISEMSYKKRIRSPEELVTPGDVVDVVIKEINTETRRISLSIKDAEGDPWIDIVSRYKVGQPVEGVIEKKEKFGYFITLEPGITGLLPKSSISQSQNSARIDKLKEGDPITVIVEDIQNNERRIRLGAGDAKDEEDWRKYSDNTQTSVGSFGEKLKQAIQEKSKQG